jgi:RNA polymerase sigma factor (sigma-70 family)
MTSLQEVDATVKQLIAVGRSLRKDDNAILKEVGDAAVATAMRVAKPLLPKGADFGSDAWWKRLRSLGLQRLFQQPWLLRQAAYYVALQQRRSQSKDEALIGSVGTLDLPDLHTPSPTAGAESEELGTILRSALDRLDPKSRAIVRLFHFGHRSISEIAVLVNESIDNVSKILQRARGRLAELLESQREALGFADAPAGT